MSNLVENKFGMDPEGFGANIPITSQENFVNVVYSSLDEVTSDELDRLHIEDDIISSCEMGCSHCCQYHIISNIAEAHALVQYVKRELSQDQRNDLRMRTQLWHAWDSSRPGRYPAPTTIDEQIDFSNYVHRCPLLVNDACIAYPVRPFVCRTHYVSSDPQFCSAANDLQSTGDFRVVLSSVEEATHPFSMALRDHIENTGMSYFDSMMLLPHLLAIKMGWEFAIVV